MGEHAALVGRLLEAANALADDIPSGTREIADLEGDVRLDELDLYCVGKLTEAAYAINALEAQLAEASAALAVCRESLVEQAAARLDPTMPLLMPDVVERLREDSEVAYALAEDAEERIDAHGLALLCDWQDRARAARTEAAA